MISVGVSILRVCMASFIDAENQSSFGRPHLFTLKILGIFEPYSNKACRRGSSRLARRICPSSKMQLIYYIKQAVASKERRLICFLSGASKTLV